MSEITVSLTSSSLLPPSLSSSSPLPSHPVLLPPHSLSPHSLLLPPHPPSPTRFSHFLIPHSPSPSLSGFPFCLPIRLLTLNEGHHTHINSHVFSNPTGLYRRYVTLIEVDLPGNCPRAPRIRDLVARYGKRMIKRATEGGREIYIVREIEN